MTFQKFGLVTEHCEELKCHNLLEICTEDCATNLFIVSVIFGLVSDALTKLQTFLAVILQDFYLLPQIELHITFEDSVLPGCCVL